MLGRGCSATGSKTAEMMRLENGWKATPCQSCWRRSDMLSQYDQPIQGLQCHAVLHLDVCGRSYTGWGNSLHRSSAITQYMQSCHRAAQQLTAGQVLCAYQSLGTHPNPFVLVANGAIGQEFLDFNTQVLRKDEHGIDATPSVTLAQAGCFIYQVMCVMMPATINSTPMVASRRSWSLPSLNTVPCSI